VWSLYRAHRNPQMEFSLFDLVMENGRVSKIAVMTMGTWGVLVYGFIHLLNADKMTEGLFGLFGGLCFTPMVAKMFTGPSSTLISSTTTTDVEITK
jgi:hypothetical protein